MANETKSILGKNATYAQEGLKFEVTITDVKNAYGTERCLITPVSGSGEKWVFKNKLKVLDTKRMLAG